MATTVFDPSEGPSAEQQAAEASALEQGEKIAKLQEEDKARRLDQSEASNEDAGLIAGKFKSQDDLIKAYNELQSKLGKDSPSEEEEPAEEQPEAVEETPESEPNETLEYMTSLSEEFEKTGDLSEEAIEKLSSMDTKDLVKSYLEYYTKTAQASTQQALQEQQINDIKATVGGEQAYTDLIRWAGENLPQADIDSFNAVTNTNNPAAIRFAVESLSNRQRAQEGYEAPLVTGKAPSSKAKVFRSHAELSRAIADPRYQNDPAYRSDIEARLARSTDLL